MFAAVLAAGLAIRFGTMRSSLWLDESWVANSVLAPSISGMFYFDRWVQSTPPLFLWLARMWTGAFGPGEAAMRATAWIAGAAGACMLALVLRRLFTPLPALLGTALFLVNYNAIKYSQQVKQYSTDLLAAILLLAMIVWCLRRDSRAPSTVGLALGATACLALSYTSVFWLPALLLAFVFAPQLSGAPPEPPASAARRWLTGAALAAVLAASVAAVWLIFVNPNLDPDLVERQTDRFIGSGGLRPSLGRFGTNMSELLLPQINVPARLLSYALGSLALAGAGRVLFASAVGRSARARQIALATLVPLATGMAMSLAGQYPLLVYTRYVIWLLPVAVVLIICAVEPAATVVERWADRRRARPAVFALAATASIAALAGVGFILARLAPPGEDVRGVHRWLMERVIPEDDVYLHGGVAEQFRYYIATRHEAPPSLYWGTTGWPCCPRNLARYTTNPAARTLGDELRDFAASAHGARLWLVMPSAEPGHWSISAHDAIWDTPNVLAPLGWTLASKTAFPGVIAFELRKS